MYSIYFIEDENTKETRRHVLNVWVFLSDLGGIMEILFISCLFVIYFFQTFLFEVSLMKRIFFK